MRRHVSAVLFWGGLWGISEATVSYLVHLFLPGMGWVFYYPLAYGFMAGACRQLRVLLRRAALHAGYQVSGEPQCYAAHRLYRRCGRAA